MNRTPFRATVRVLLLVGIVSSSAQESLPKNSFLQSGQWKNFLSTTARAIVNPSVTITVAETRVDSTHVFPIFPELKTVQEVKTFYDGVELLALQRAHPLFVIRGEPLPQSIWVSFDPFVASSEDLGKRHIPHFSGDSVFLCFLEPVRELPRRPIRTNSSLFPLLANLDPKLSPYEQVARLGLSDWVNKATWWVPIDQSGIVKLTKNIRGIEAAKKGNVARQDEWDSRIREAQAKNPVRNRQLTLSEVQLSEITALAKLFADPESPPSVEKLLSMKSEFADAVLMHLAESSSAELPGKLGELKDSIPSDIRERLQRLR